MFDPHNPIRNPKFQDLTQEAAVGAHLAYMKESVQMERYYEALLSSKFVRTWLQVHPEYQLNTTPLYEQLRTVFVDNSWIALQMLRDENVVVDLLSKHLLALFTIPDRYKFDYPTDDMVDRLLLEGMRSYLLNYMLFEDRDRIKRRLQVALETSETQITTAPFYLGIKQVTPTLKNWFEVYKTYMGSAMESDTRRKKFLTISENGAALKPAERKLLADILTLHRRLGLSSLDPFGMEEEISYTEGDESGIFLYGEQFPHDKETVKTIHELVGTPANTIADHPPISTISAKVDPNFVVTGPDVEATKGPDHFSEADLAEIEEHAQVSAQLNNPGAVNYQRVAETVKEEVALSFKSPEDEKRFTDLVVSVLRGLRDTMELKQYLLDLSFPSAECEVVVAAVRQHMVGAPAKQQSAKAPYQLASKPTLQQLQKHMAPVVATQTVAPQSNVQVEPPQAPTAAVARKTFLPKLRRSRAVKRPLVDDVRLQPSMVMGPIDELRAMDTLEFRRLSPDPVLAARRLKDKIELLAEESITKQAEGIDAFKQSPLNTLYLELGNESISSGKPVNVVIAERQTTGTPTLSEVEFNAISDLNKQIRF